MEQLDTLIKESDVANRMPVFYQNYQELNKKNREAYFQNLLDPLFASSACIARAARME